MLPSFENIILIQESFSSFRKYYIFVRKYDFVPKKVGYLLRKCFFVRKRERSEKTKILYLLRKMISRSEIFLFEETNRFENMILPTKIIGFIRGR